MSTLHAATIVNVSTGQLRYTSTEATLGSIALPPCCAAAAPEQPGLRQLSHPVVVYFVCSWHLLCYESSKQAAKALPLPNLATSQSRMGWFEWLDLPQPPRPAPGTHEARLEELRVGALLKKELAKPAGQRDEALVWRLRVDVHERHLANAKARFAPPPLSPPPPFVLAIGSSSLHLPAAGSAPC